MTATIPEGSSVFFLPTDGYQFEREVADLYRALGAEVAHNVSLAGIQIDVIARETTPGGTTLTRLVECKDYQRPVGTDQVRLLAATSHLLRERNLISVATLVARKGFTAMARETANALGVELIELADLRTKASKRGFPPPSEDAHSEPPGETEGDSERAEAARAFVALPFTPRYDDVYLLGIRGAAEAAGISVERADENLDSTEIINYIKARIVSCDLMIADTSEVNPNVFYELGFADGLDKPVVLIAAAGTELAFDIQGRNHVLYENIGALRNVLSSRLKQFRD